jgi:hypothetical protein
MRDTLFATFVRAGDAGQTLCTLLDHGVNRQDLSVILSDPRLTAFEHGRLGLDRVRTDSHAPLDGGRGTPHWFPELDLSILATLVAPTLPGFGIILGNGTLGKTLAVMSDGTSARTVSPGSLRCLVDQGVPAESVESYYQIIREGGALVSIPVPSGTLSEFEIRSILSRNAYMTLETFHVICDMGHNSSMTCQSTPSSVPPR